MGLSMWLIIGSDHRPSVGKDLSGQQRTLFVWLLFDNLDLQLVLE